MTKERIARFAMMLFVQFFCKNIQNVRALFGVGYAINQFQFVEQNSVECPSDFGANFVQHFIGRYSRYSRYQTVLLKLQKIIYYFLYTKALLTQSFLFLQGASICKNSAVHIIKRSETTSLFVSERVQIALRTFCKEQKKCVAPPCKRRSSQRVFTFCRFYGII